MGFTTISRLTLIGGPATGDGVEGYFHPLDINIVMGQVDDDGARPIAVELRNAVTASGKLACVLIGVKRMDSAGGILERMTGPDALVAVKCPPLTYPAGRFIEEP